VESTGIGQDIWQDTTNKLNATFKQLVFFLLYCHTAMGEQVGQALAILVAWPACTDSTRLQWGINQVGTDNTHTHTTTDTSTVGNENL